MSNINYQYDNQYDNIWKDDYTIIYYIYKDYIIYLKDVHNSLKLESRSQCENTIKALLETYPFLFMWGIWDINKSICMCNVRWMNTHSPETHLLQEDVSMKRKYLSSMLIFRGDLFSGPKSLAKKWTQNVHEFVANPHVYKT